MDTELTRALVAEVDRTLADLDGSDEKSERLSLLRESWLRLVNHLALGPAPEVRSCPACGGTIMRAATRCVHCWVKSLPPPEGEATTTAKKGT
jgi:hypothetical protein